MTWRFYPLPRAARFALFYGALYAGFGAYLPYMPVWFEGRGLSAEMIGAAAAAAMAGRVIAAPLGAMRADRARRRRDAIAGFALASLLVFAAHIPAREPWLIVALAALAGAALTGMIPVIDAFAIRESRRRGFAFGLPRAFGSATFIIGNVGGGALVSAFGGEAALYWIIAGGGLTVLAALFLPEGRRAAPAVRESAQSGLVRALSGARMPLAFAISGLIHGSHGFYYAFSAVAWKADGISAATIGLLWAAGVGAEIVFFSLAARYFASVSPALLMAVGAAASLLRWGVLAFSPPLAALFVLQGLHGLTFGASYLGFLRYAADHVPERHAAMAQAVNSALAGGLILAAATYASGHAYAAFATAGFATMALPAGIGLVLALGLALRARSGP